MTMTKIQKMFLILVGSYFLLKGIIAFLLYVVSERVKKKGMEFKKKRESTKKKNEKTV